MTKKEYADILYRVAKICIRNKKSLTHVVKHIYPTVIDGFHEVSGKLCVVRLV
jgi:hypothetical protein